jgi:hypothetical protein
MHIRVSFENLKGRYTMFEDSDVNLAILKNVFEGNRM